MTSCICPWLGHNYKAQSQNPRCVIMKGEKKVIQKKKGPNKIFEVPKFQSKVL
jgi:hypothetical protein